MTTPHDTGAQAELAWGYRAKRQPDRFRIEAERPTTLNPHDARDLGDIGIDLASSGFWDEGTALAGKAIKLMGPAARPLSWWAPAKRHFFGGEYTEACGAFRHAYTEGLWISQLDLAYTLPFLGRIDEAKARVAALPKMYPTMTIREAVAFHRLVSFEPAYREKVAAALRQAGSRSTTALRPNPTCQPVPRVRFLCRQRHYRSRGHVSLSR